MPKSWKFEHPYTLIANYHQPLIPLFGSASGLGFMHAESEIIIRVLLRLKAAGIRALPIHDCVLIANSAEEVEFARVIMEQAFEEVIGTPGKVEVEGEIGRRLLGMSISLTEGIPDTLVDTCKTPVEGGIRKTTVGSPEGLLTTPEDTSRYS